MTGMLNLQRTINMKKSPIIPDERQLEYEAGILMQCQKAIVEDKLLAECYSRLNNLIEIFGTGHPPPNTSEERRLEFYEAQDNIKNLFRYIETRIDAICNSYGVTRSTYGEIKKT